MAITQQSHRTDTRPRRFTFFSQGTGYSFDPSKKANVAGKLSNLLELHLSEVAFRNNKHTYILNDVGTLYERENGRSTTKR